MSSFVASALTLCLVVGFAFESRAQDAALPINLVLKTVRQSVSGTEQKPGKITLNAKKLFEMCVSMPPTQGQGLFVFVECGIAGGATLGAYDKGTGEAVGIGTIVFNYAPPAVVTTVNGGSVKARTLPFDLHIHCGSAVDIDANGVMDVTYQTSGDFCTSSMKAKMTGSADIDPLGVVLIDEGSSISASKPFLIPDL